MIKTINFIRIASLGHIKNACECFSFNDINFSLT